MLRYGKMCSGCGRDCVDKGAFQIECPSCDGYGCGNCVDGMIELDGCPQDMCRGVWPKIEAIKLFHEGIPPIAGGSLDQSASFVEAARFYKNTCRRIEAESGI